MSQSRFHLIPTGVTRRIRTFILLLGLLGFSGGLSLSGFAQQPGVAEWKARLDRYLSEPRFEQATWGIQAVSLSTGEVLYQLNPGKLMRPASTAKLFTAGLALERLGPDYKIETSLHAGHRPDENGLLPGDLVVYGRGDPSFSARYRPGEGFLLEELFQVLQNAGIKEILGGLVGDETFFRGGRHGAGWTWEDLGQGYGTGASALSIHDNLLLLHISSGEAPGKPARILVSPSAMGMEIVNLTSTVPGGETNSISFEFQNAQQLIVSGGIEMSSAPVTLQVPSPNPAQLFISILRDEIAQRGIRVHGGTRIKAASTGSASEPLPALNLGSVFSPPLEALVGETLKNSHNLSAQLLLWHIGAQAEERGGPDQLSSIRRVEQAGVHQLREWLSREGLPGREILLEDGAGLSRRNLATPRAVVSFLVQMKEHEHGEILLNSLPLAGTSGTLARRFSGTPLEGKIRAKTGSLKHTAALAGFLQADDGDEIVFAVFLQNYEPLEGGQTDQQSLDTLIKLLAGMAPDEANLQSPGRNQAK